MKKVSLYLKYLIYYIIGIISFSIIAFISQRITTAILLKDVIDPSQDLNNLLNYIRAYWIYYLPVYTILYFIILFCVKKYDKYMVNKVNELLKKNKKDNYGGTNNVER